MSSRCNQIFPMATNAWLKMSYYTPNARTKGHNSDESGIPSIHFVIMEAIYQWHSNPSFYSNYFQRFQNLLACLMSLSSWPLIWSRARLITGFFRQASIRSETTSVTSSFSLPVNPCNYRNSSNGHLYQSFATYSTPGNQSLDVSNGRHEMRISDEWAVWCTNWFGDGLETNRLVRRSGRQDERLWCDASAGRRRLRCDIVTLRLRHGISRDSRQVYPGWSAALPGFQVRMLFWRGKLGGVQGWKAMPRVVLSSSSIFYPCLHVSQV